MNDLSSDLCPYCKHHTGNPAYFYDWQDQFNVCPHCGNTSWSVGVSDGKQEKFLWMKAERIEVGALGNAA